MEQEGLRRGLEKLLALGLKIHSLATDRHPGITKWLDQTYKDILHYFDVWHVCKCELTVQWVSRLFSLVSFVACVTHMRISPAVKKKLVKFGLSDDGEELTPERIATIISR